LEGIAKKYCLNEKSSMPAFWQERVAESRQMMMEFARFYFPVRGGNKVYLGHFDPNVSQKTHRCYLGSLFKKLPSFAGYEELFFSPAEFDYTRSAKSAAVQNGIFLDIESSYKHRENEGSIDVDIEKERILETCSENNIPKPSIIVFTGSGLHPHWVFPKRLYCRENTKYAKNRARWKRVIKALQKIFSENEHNVDTQVCGLNQLLRLPGGVHAKTGEMARVVHWGDKVDFDELEAKLLPPDDTQTKDKQKKQKKELKINIGYVGSGKKGGEGRFNLNTLNFDRINDIIYLINSRWENEMIPEGYRNRFIFILTSILALQNNNFDKAKKEAKSILQGKISKEWIEQEEWKLSYIEDRVLRYLRGEEPDPRFTYETKTIIDHLGITPEEEQVLKTLFSKLEKHRRRAVREGWQKTNDQKHQERQERVREAKKLREQNYTNQEIADMLGVSERSVKRYLNGK